MPLRREHARMALAPIRLVNGVLNLLAPEVMLRRLGADPRPSQVAVYPQRIPGIRTRDPGRRLAPARQRPVQAQAWQPRLRTVDRRQLLP